MVLRSAQLIIVLATQVQFHLERKRKKSKNGFGLDNIINGLKILFTYSYKWVSLDNHVASF